MKMTRKGMLYFVTLVQLNAILVSASPSGPTEDENRIPKPFGLGQGPFFLGGRDTDAEGTKIALRIYRQFLVYQKFIGKSFLEDEQYYDRWTRQNQCVGACPANSGCDSGFCVCHHEAGWTQVHGRCEWNSTAVFLGDDHKYRKPKPPEKPRECLCKKRNSQIKEVCSHQRDNPACADVHYPNVFDHNNQFCSAGNHRQCFSKDINMFCSQDTRLDPEAGVERNLCQCRKDMKFDSGNMECRVFIDVDCTYVEREESQDPGQKTKDILNTLENGAEPTENFSVEDVKAVFCNLLDREADDYSAHLIGDFTILGLTLTGFLVAALISCITCCCCCKCCESIKSRLRALDPRNALKGGQGGTGGGGGGGIPTEMAALGAVAAGEYLANREEAGDEARIAAMQGQSMALPGGAPPGYAPVPTGYPQPPYYGGPPPAGYAAVPGGGYIPPQDGGPGLMAMAPELALAGAGAFTGNTNMLAMGAVAAAEKVGESEDKEDRLRAAAIRGVPPPPPGYAGGYQPGYQPNPLPPSSAVYPRQ